ncbi:hydantoinase B/oxoprolinase family protein [Candidatus Rariloculus sp.]|uniref:hydantoinase B/oxoprolinase family protein n=1 Tax=Candidatus Rariloculus sp. TaxID=3101265 RepID=UPI003D1438F4
MNLSSLKTAQRQGSLDPVTLEVIRNALPAISDEMSVDLQRTSYNMMIYEVRDYCTALLDADGALISQNIGGVSHFVADLGVIVIDAVARYGRDGFAPGDVLLHNHQATAGQHLNNVVVYTPMFYEGELLAFAMVRAHWVDVGGLSTGFGAGWRAYDPWSEGLQLDQIKLYEGGVLDEKLLRLIRDNIRFPDNAMGDMRSQLAACRLGERRFKELLDRYGKSVVLDAIQAFYSETEAKCRAAVAEIPDGVYRAASHIDWRDGRYDIKVELTVSGSDMTIDLSGCSPEREGGANSRTFAGAYIAYKAITTPLEPLNEGAFSALKVIIPEGNMMMARYPAYMSGWSMPLPTVVDTILLALAKAIPERIPAAHSGSLGAALSFSGRDPARNKSFVVMSIESGGWGGRCDADGQDASMSVCQGDVRNAPIENIELKGPVLVEERAVRPDSGGPGQFRGGLGVHTRIRSLVSGRLNVASGSGGRVSCPPWGLAGGKPGQIAATLVKAPGDDEFHESADQRPVWPADTRVAYMTAGGGGWGDPLDRDPERILRDVREAYVSAESARDDYGVVLSAGNGDIDLAATNELRARLRKGAIRQ